MDVGVRESAPNAADMNVSENFHIVENSCCEWDDAGLDCVSKEGQQAASGDEGDVR